MVNDPANTRVKVLVVEDVEEMRIWLGELLTLVGFEVTGLAQNIWEARLELDRRCPDVMLLDEVLPGESSFDFLPEALHHQVSVILLTGIENPSHPVPAGVWGRISKPGWKPTHEEKMRIQKAVIDASNQDLVLQKPTNVR